MFQIPGKIPITIHPAFWLVAAIIGFINSLSFLGTLIWIIVILISVLIHELGHATTALLFGLKPRIELVAFGGLTYHKGEGLAFWKQFFIVLNGPLFGFMLFVIAFLLLKVPALSMGVTGSFLTLFYWINLIWTILNLVPVMPLDGGQLLRVVMESIFGIQGFRYSLLIGTVVAGLMSLGFFLYQRYLIGALFFLFAFQSFDAWKKMRTLSEPDRSEGLKEALEAAEIDLEAGRKEKAISELEKIRLDAKKGMIYTASTQYLAFIKFEQGNSLEAYQLLLPIRPELSAEALCLLHKAAFTQKDFSLVADLAAGCFQTLPNYEVALRNACAFAALSQAKPALGWLETAFQEGLENVKEVLQEPYFDAIRTDPHFESFLKHHQ